MAVSQALLLQQLPSTCNQRVIWCQQMLRMRRACLAQLCQSKLFLLHRYGLVVRSLVGDWMFEAACGTRGLVVRMYVCLTGGCTCGLLPT